MRPMKLLFISMCLAQEIGVESFIYFVNGGKTLKLIGK